MLKKIVLTIALLFTFYFEVAAMCFGKPLSKVGQPSGACVQIIDLTDNGMRVRTVMHLRILAGVLREIAPKIAESCNVIADALGNGTCDSIIN